MTNNRDQKDYLYHHITVSRRASADGDPRYQAVCDCGWGGDVWKDKDYASEDTTSHANAMTRLGCGVIRR